MVSEYSDNLWLISDEKKKLLRDDLLTSMDLNNTDYKFELGFHQSFDRNLPATAKRAKTNVYKNLNFTKKGDCNTRKELIKLAKFDCNQPENAN